MHKLTLQDWASIAEIVGTFAVVVSLMFVVQSVNRNTRVVQIGNLNHVYNRVDSLNSDIAADPELAAMYAERVFGLSEITHTDAQFLASLRRELNQWEQSFSWHRDEFMSESDWLAWNEYYMNLFARSFPEQWWKALRQDYTEEFAAHVDQVYYE